jgi:hypothetical protein
VAKRRYVVIGPRRVCETDPGHEFERDLTTAEEKTLLGVHIRVVEPTPAPPKPKKAAPKRRVNPQPQSEE